MAESIYQQVALQKEATEREENRNCGTIPHKDNNFGRISHKERKVWEDTTQREETIARGGTLAQSTLKRGKERIMKAWAQKANVAFCTIFFFYQVCPTTYFVCRMIVQKLFNFKIIEQL